MKARSEGSPASAAHSPPKSSPGALAYLARQSGVPCRACRTIERWARGVGYLFYPSGARTDAPRYDLAACRKSAPQPDTPDIRNA